MKIRKMLTSAVSLLLLSGMALLSLCGCSAGGETEPIDMVIVTLNGKSMPQSDPAAMGSLIEQATSSKIGSTISLIIADGKPHLAGTTICFSESQANNSFFWEQEKSGRRDQINALLTQQAVTPGTNLLEGIRLAGRQLQAGKNHKKLLVISHLGVNTEPPLEMCSSDITTALNEEAVQQLKDSGYLAELSDCEVHYFFLGEGSGDQPSLNPTQTSALEAFWESYLKASGAASVTFEKALPSTQQVQDAPDVPIIAVPQSNIDLSSPISLDPLVVSFQPDSAQLADKSAARQQLAGIAGMMRTSDSRFLLAGSTATVESIPKASSQQFGLLRAQAVRDLLREMDVDPGKIACVGLGAAETSVRSADDDQANRTVWLVPMDHPLAAEFQDVGLPE